MKPSVDGQSKPKQLLPHWQAAWSPALAVWSRFTKLTQPVWLFDEHQERQQGLAESFAMIRLVDHSVVVSLRQVAEMGLGRFAKEVLAHEIGHHVLAPADLADNARMLARLRAALPGMGHLAPFVGNLYTDLLINDRLQRVADFDLAGLYQALKSRGDPGTLWNLYMRMYEQLWSLPTGTLTQGSLDPDLAADAVLGARLIRVYRQDWLEGVGRFATLLYPYLGEDKGTAERPFGSLLDASRAGEGGEIPDGLAEIEEGEITGGLHPRDDPDLSGIDGTRDAEKSSEERGEGEAKRGGRKRRYRGPREYTELMQSSGVKVPPEQLVMRYYKELARRHLIPFPTRELPRTSDPQPEGLESWDPGEPVSSVDWLESVIRSPKVIPGITTVQRSYSETEGEEPSRRPLDLYLGIDCSGSMVNPAVAVSYPVLAGAVVALSALRTGAHVMACLSGEPGKYDQTDGLVRSEQEILRLLTSYLGTGYAFGAGRLEETIVKAPPPVRPLHILIISDADLFYMLDQYENGWAVAEQAAQKSGGGATAVLNIPYRRGKAEQQAIERLNGIGWQVQLVSSEEELVGFARAFARRRYHAETGAAG